MSRTYTKLYWKLKTDKYHKNHANKRLRKTDLYLFVSKTGNQTLKKVYDSWKICDLKYGGLKYSYPVRNGKNGTLYQLKSKFK
ncbi:MAG: hypothetical protein LBH40_06075 [Alphaproteobacteria bacterium]|jgi:hypothetical protein|nr:hypothetical protein [Alphaproteobacteria bacterium]